MNSCSPFENRLALMVSPIWSAYWLAQRAKARFSAPAVRSLAIPLTSSSRKPMIEPSTLRISASCRTWPASRTRMVSSKRPDQPGGDQSQPPAIPEEQAEVEQGDQPGDQCGDGRAGDLLEDQAQAHGPQRQVSRGEPAEESRRQSEQAIPDRGDDGRHNLALDPEQRPAPPPPEGSQW